MNKKIGYGIGGLVVLFLLWRIISLIYTGSSNAGPRSGPPPVAVEVDSVRHGYLAETRQLTGTVFPQYKYVVAPKVSGRVMNLYKRIGDWVEDGEVVARIDDAEYEQNVIEAEANLNIALASLAEAETQFELARQDLDRVRSLQSKGIASSSELDAALSNYTAQESRYQLAQAQVDQRRAALKSAQIRLSYTVLTASKPGFVGERFVDEGALLAPNTAVLSIVGIDSVIVRTTIIERDYGYIRVNQPAQVSVDAFRDRTFHGSVSRIAPMLQEASRVAEMEVEVANGSRALKPGMFARVSIQTAERPNAQYVPSRALVRQGSETGVYLVNPQVKSARYVSVEIGIVSAEFTEIVAPELNDMVVTLGQHLLDDGSPVILPEDSEMKQSERAS
ncbi:MAG: efflux RND transporter periplasmic adaptor subunit [Candidatus Marinimicrobia bacterium]|nr:efflux RND transporter periplasmic adaptor subunit [Candidatus Neomarinimicrobiota bacterium]MCF7840188.1 efflux RND transporter periplasmic adaptor subunit [Candidatus Neomarinimicrobiota bacterium]